MQSQEGGATPITTYFISPAGSDASNGLGPDASHASNKPWLTLGKAMNTGSPVSPGDTVYIGPGEYFSTSATPISGITSAGSRTAFRGDPWNLQGFKNGSGVLLAPRSCYLARRASTERDAVATGGAMLIMTTNNPNGLIFSGLIFEHAGTGALLSTSMAGSNTLDFDDCVFIYAGTTGSVGCFDYLAGTVVQLTHRFRRCLMLCCGQSATLRLNHGTAAASADLDIDIVLEDCVFIALQGNPSVIATASTQAGNKWGGIIVKGCTAIAEELLQAAGGHSTVTPSRASGCLLFGSRMFNANTAGQLVDDGYNRSYGCNSFTNTTQAGTTILRPMPNIVLPGREKWGYLPGALPMFGWDSFADAAQKFSGWTRTLPDFLNGIARPWGGGPSIGAIEYADLSQDATSAITGGGVNSIKIIGQGEVSFYLAVGAVATTISVVTKSTTYGGTNYPQLVVVADGEIGLTADVTATASSASEQTITSASFTPSVAGVVCVRLISRSTTVTSSTYFDLLTRNS